MKILHSVPLSPAFVKKKIRYLPSEVRDAGIDLSAWLSNGEPYDTKRRPTMLFDVPARLEYDPCREERQNWDTMQVPLPWEGRTFAGGWNNV
jgi:hypothetical protein